MPQMAPLSWLMLMLTFVLIMMIFNSTNFFNSNYNPQISSFFKKTSLTNWKW
uniref:ATP synthase complex subunit 8 n=1 Tax=Cheironitis sp. MJTNT-2012 TaxID=2558026 RepID=S4SVA6_9SCAR|nr:ATP synthase subunit 8 [Aegus fukiensis]AFQ62178.1 ATP synthase F0 subunit 8 [Cheironitis sp. MJTNT-2012]WQB61565.1 ATP synthase subunit 8 [Aegus fukiensis]